MLQHGIDNFVWTGGSGSDKGKLPQRDLWQPREVHWKRKESRKRNETAQGMWLSEAGAGSRWLCYAMSLAEEQKSEIAFVGEKQLGKLGEEEGEEEEPETE